MNTPLNYEDFMTLARENYNKGGDQCYECWDKNTFDEYVKLCGRPTKKDALEMFAQDYELEQEWANMAKW